MKGNRLIQEVCQQCAECCKISRYYTSDKDHVLRISYLNIKDISIKRLENNYYKITFNIPCSKLKQKTLQGKTIYFCSEHNGSRPDFCKAYPYNFAYLDEVFQIEEAKLCPQFNILKDPDSRTKLKMLSSVSKSVVLERESDRARE